jgi:hypothetical protein
VATPTAGSRFQRALVGAILICLLAVYVGSYLALSRAGFAYADAYDMNGFYFSPPENSDRWRFWNYTCVRLYYPLILVDNWLGTGRAVGAEPTWSLAP